MLYSTLLSIRMLKRNNLTRNIPYMISRNLAITNSVKTIRKYKEGNENLWNDHDEGIPEKYSLSYIDLLKPMSLNTYKPCKNCLGKGYIPCDYCMEGCTMCGYTGYVLCDYCYN